MKKMVVGKIILMFTLVTTTAYGFDLALYDEIPPGSITPSPPAYISTTPYGASHSLGDWDYKPHDPCVGSRSIQEVESPFGTGPEDVAIEAYMGSCGGTCGSYMLTREHTFDIPLDRSSTIIRFDGEFDIFGSSSHNRAQVQFIFYKDGVNLGNKLYGYETLGRSYNMPPSSTFASGNWEFGIDFLPDDPDTIVVSIHPRSCFGNGSVKFDNFEVYTESAPFCGDGTIDEDEECDDGNQESGDGCTSACIIECTDSDDDGFCDTEDNCPTVANPNQSNVDGDEFGDACEPDNDNDGVIDDDDNCPLDTNAYQEDFDGDGVGNVCDVDMDGDGVIDADDVCLGTQPNELVLANGCSIDQECACESSWKNHGAYIKCIVQASSSLLKEGLITDADKGLLVSEAANSRCGSKKK